MREYAKVSPQFWTRGSGKRLRGDADAQVLALYFVTCPSANMLGVYYVPFVAVAHETGLGEERTRAALRRLSVAGFAFYDEAAELAWVPNMASYQIGDDLKPSDKRRGGPIRAEIEKIGEHAFVVAFWERYGDGFGLGPCPFDAPPMGLTRGIEAPPMGHAPQSGRAGEEQEQEQEHLTVAPMGLPADGSEVGRKRAKASRGTRVPEDFSPSESTLALFRADGWDPLPSVPEFIDHWRAVAGAKGVKLDWDATFRNRMRDLIAWGRAARWRPPAAPKPPEAPETLMPREDVAAGLQAMLASIVDPYAVAERLRPPGESST